MESGDVKINRIKSKNRAYMQVLDDVLAPEVLHAKVPRLGELAEARVQHKARMDTIRELGQWKNKNLSFVAEIDQSVWSAVLSVFARHDPDTGELIDDGLLYKTDENGTIKMNRDFFFALLDGPLKAYDFRFKKTIM